LAPGYRADLAVWPVDGIASSGAWDKVAGLILSPPAAPRDVFAKAARLYAILRFPGSMRPRLLLLLNPRYPA
jgi:hypothetical protein